MANLLLRSPHYEYHNQAGALSAILELSLDGGLFYTISKDVDENNGVLFEISELARDYIDPQFTGAYISETLAITGTIVFYDLIGGVGTPVGQPVNITHTGFDGYTYFQDTEKHILSGSLLQSNSVVYIPEGLSGEIPYESGGGIAYQSFLGSDTSINAGGHIITIERICDTKFSPIKMIFLNKFGAYQDMWFDKKSVSRISADGDTYKGSTINGLGIYNVSSHNTSILSKNGSESVTVNTGFMDEVMYYPMKELMLSEKVWVKINDQILPINITTNTLTNKTKVNDKLIQYSLDFTYSFDIINNIR